MTKGNRDGCMIDFIQSGNKNAVKALLDCGDDPNQEYDGWPMLHWAVYVGDKHIVQILLDSGANRSCVNSKGESAYDIAVRKGQYGLASMIRRGQHN